MAGAVAFRPHNHVEPATNAQRIAVADAPGDSLSITFGATGTSEVHLHPGTYEFDVTANADGHVIALRGPGVDLPGQPVDRAHALVKLTARLRAGTYVLLCVVPGHDAAGEHATIIVE